MYTREGGMYVLVEDSYAVEVVFTREDTYPGEVVHATEAAKVHAAKAVFV